MVGECVKYAFERSMMLSKDSCVYWCRLYVLRLSMKASEMSLQAAYVNLPEKKVHLRYTMWRRSWKRMPLPFLPIPFLTTTTLHAIERLQRLIQSCMKECAETSRSLIHIAAR